MILAALGDIHGNLPALEAVLAAIDSAGVQTVLNTGDCVVGQPWPNEVIELLRERDILSVQGELDRLALRFLRKRNTLSDRGLDAAMLDAIRETHETTRSANIEFLRGLPRCRVVTIDGIPIALCHGMPASQSDSLEADAPETKFRRQRETTGARIIVSGRTHKAFARMVDDALFVNPGSVGVPTGKAQRARYALVSTEDEPWAADLRWAAY